MKIMVIADTPSIALWEHFSRNAPKDVDLIISCGDLDPDYLTFLVTMLNVPLLYVRGDQDIGYDKRHPSGCINIDGKVYQGKGVRVAGLGGCMAYAFNGTYQRTEGQMRRRLFALRWKLMKYGGVDILVTHAPAAGLGDRQDDAHRGFRCFTRFIEQYQPAVFVHGHIPKDCGGLSFQRSRMHGNTCVINASGVYYFEL